VLTAFLCKIYLLHMDREELGPEAT
jgi:hypothetical protein